MPLLHSAIKKLAVDRRRERENRRYRDAYAAAVKLARKQPTVKNLKSAFCRLWRIKQRHRYGQRLYETTFKLCRNSKLKVYYAT